MSRTTKEINKVTTTIISVSCRLLVYILVFFLLYEGVTRGYSYGHEIFSPTAVSEEPGREIQVVVNEGDSVKTVAKELKRQGLIKDDFIFVIQSMFYEYEMHPGAYALNTAMTSMDMLKLIDGNTGKDEEDKS